MHYTGYRHLALSQWDPAPDPAELAEIEKLLGATLPADYIEFLKTCNGGYLECVIDVPMNDGGTEELSFCDMFSTRALASEILAAREYQHIPSGVLPFARDGGSSMVYLDLTAEGRGRVVAFVHGLPAWTGLRTESAFIEIASPFTDYVNKLRIDRELLFDQLKNDVTDASHVDATEEWLDISLPRWRDDGEIAAAVAAARKRVSKPTV